MVFSVHSTQQYLLRLERCENIGDIIFDSLNHDLFIAKLEAYGVDLSSPSLIISSCISREKQRTKVNNSFRKWSEITSGFPRVLYWVLFFLAYILMIYSTLLMMMTLQTMQMTRSRIA